MNLFQFKILDNDPVILLWFAGIILFAFIIRKYLSQIAGFALYKIFHRPSMNNTLSKFQSLVLPSLQYVLFLFIVRIALEMLRYPSLLNITIWKYPLQDILNLLLMTLIWWCVTRLLLRTVEFIGYTMYNRALPAEIILQDQWVPFVKDTIKIVLFVFSLLFLFGVVYGLNVTSLIAGVGIGGLAIALAAQESLKNLFGSLTIFLDKPFRLGDFVKIGTVQGTVEKIGFRSTRIRTADTTYVTLPNRMMVDSSVDNVTSRNHFRVKLILGLRYGTKANSLRNIIQELRRVIATRADKSADNYVVFDSFGETSLSISIEYFISLKPNKEFLQEKEEINFQIMEIIERHGGEFFYPVQEIRRADENKNLPQ